MKVSYSSPYHDEMLPTCQGCHMPRQRHFLHTLDLTSTAALLCWLARMPHTHRSVPPCDTWTSPARTGHSVRATGLCQTGRGRPPGTGVKSCRAPREPAVDANAPDLQPLHRAESRSIGAASGVRYAGRLHLLRRWTARSAQSQGASKAGESDSRPPAHEPRCPTC